VKRLLLIAYEFPPKGGTQAQHAAKLASGLSARGWDVTALTVADPPAPMLDPRLAEETAAAGVITRVAYSLEPTRAVQAMRRRKAASADGPAPTASAAPAAGARSYTSLPRWAIRLVQALFVPDEKIGWKPYAVAEALRLHRERPFDAIIATGPPYSAYSIARAVSRRTGVPWVCDLRDPIVGTYFFVPLTPLNAWQMRRFERRVVLSATRILIATRGIGTGLTERIPEVAEKISLIWNGYDPADFPFDALTPAPASDPTPQCAAQMTVSYVGTFQGSIRPDAFLSAFATVRAEDPAFATDVRVRFVGAPDAETTATIERFGLADAIERTGFVSHAQATAEMRSADVLLQVLSDDPALLLAIGSKLPEYLASGSAILLLAPAEGEAAEIVTRAGAGIVVPHDDVSAIAEALRSLHASWRAGSLPSADPAVTAEFDRTRLFAEVDAILSAVAGSQVVADETPAPEQGGA